MIASAGPHAARVVRASVLVVVASAGFGGMALGSDAALAQVSCGDTITRDTRLHRDLVGCPNNGIVIGADGVNLDLNGHRIVGDGKLFEECPEGEVCDVGIDDHGRDDVTVKDGSVRKFAIGVTVAEARRARLVRVSASRNLFFGILFRGVARSVVRDSSGNDNLDPEGDGMGLFDSHDVRIVGNSFRRNAQVGLHVEDSDHNVIEGNVFARNSHIGISLTADRNQVRRNRCERNGVCIILVRGRGNVIARNRLFGGGDGIGVENGRGNVVARNVVRGAQKMGIYVGLEDPPIGGPDNVVRRNVVIGSGKDAFHVHKAARRTLLAFNVAKRAGDDGFDVRSRSTTLSGNRAIRNADLGIEGVRGIDDGDANVARHNGDPRQCTHIACSAYGSGTRL